MRVLFMGTPEFAVGTLDAIYHSHHEIVAVVTATDKPSGRGLKIQHSEVKEYALIHNLPILQPEKLKDPEFIDTLKSFNADIFVVVAFRMLPEVVYSIPKMGTFNVHASLLPNYRGAAPIHHAVINGEKETGVTTFFLNQEIDKGDIIRSKKVAIGDTETTGELYQRLMIAGAELAVETLNAIEKGTAQRRKQEEIGILKPAPKIFKEDTHIFWNDTAQNIFNKIRGLAPFPGSFSLIENHRGESFFIKWIEVEMTQIKVQDPPGTIVTDGKKYLHIATQDYLISIKKLQFQGKSKMEVKQFLSGFHFKNYSISLK